MSFEEDLGGEKYFDSILSSIRRGKNIPGSGLRSEHSKGNLEKERRMWKSRIFMFYWVQSKPH